MVFPFSKTSLGREPTPVSTGNGRTNQPHNSFHIKLVGNIDWAWTGVNGMLFLFYDRPEKSGQLFFAGMARSYMATCLQRQGVQERAMPAN
jgi:hypothetical protein